MPWRLLSLNVYIDTIQSLRWTWLVDPVISASPIYRHLCLFAPSGKWCSCLSLCKWLRRNLKKFPKRCSLAVLSGTQMVVESFDYIRGCCRTSHSAVGHPDPLTSIFECHECDSETETASVICVRGTHLHSWHNMCIPSACAAPL